MALVIVEPIAAVLSSFDRPGPLDVGALATALNQAQLLPVEATIEATRGSFAEVAAWQVSRTGSDTSEPWGLYWKPVGSAVTADNRAIYMPDVANVDDAVLTHWIARAHTAKHPLMVARYADLAWEIGKYLARLPAKRPECEAPQATVKVSADLPRMAIDGYLAALRDHGFEDERASWQGLSRAVMLAALVGDMGRVVIAKQALFAYFEERENARGDTGYMMWWRLHDIVEHSDKALALSPQERAFIIAALQRALGEHADPGSPRFDPHLAQKAADRLLKWGPADLPQRQQIVLHAGKAFEHVAEKATAMLANSWLEDLIPRYRNVNLLDDVVRIERLIRSRSGELQNEMAEVSHTLDLSLEDMAAWADEIAGNSREEGLRNLAFRFLQQPDQVAQQVLQLKIHAPLVAIFPVSLLTADGFTDATIGSVDDDLEGRTYQMAANQLGLDEIFIHAALERIDEKHGLSADDLAAAIMASPFVGQEQEHLIRIGIDAWKAGDPVKAIHVLVPQVEAAFRGVLVAAGSSVRRPNPKVSGSKVMGFGDVLNQPLFTEGALKGMGFHLRALYTDPRAMNLRNKLAHGLAQGPTLTMGTANLVVHSLLLVTLLVKEQDRAGQ